MRVLSGLLGKGFVVLLSLATLILLSQTNHWLVKRAVVSVHQKQRYDGFFFFSSIDNNKNDSRKALRTSGIRNMTTTTPAYINNSNMPDDENNVSSTLNSIIALIPDSKANTSQSNNFGINHGLDDNMTLTTHQPIVNAIELHSLSEQANGTYYYLAQNNTERTDIHDWSNNDTKTTATSIEEATVQPSTSPLVADQPSNNIMNEDESSSSNSSRSPLCTREEIRQGEWVPLTMSAIPYVPKNIVCPPVKAYKSGPWNTWEWQPFAVKTGKCVLTKWKETQFCSLVQHATVAIVGDSLSWEQYASLAQLLGQPVTEQMQYQSHWKGSFVSHLVCQNRTRLVYLREDALKRVDLVLNTSSPNILILNRGAHFAPDSTLETELQRFVVPQVQAWQESCQKSQRPCRLFVRTTVPGHPRCANFTEPVQSAREMELLIANMSYYLSHQRTFHWEDFQRQNHLSLRVYHEANLTFDVLDGYDINILRPDDHINPVNSEDCLHSCFPGKMDTYNQLLLHFLQRSGGVAMNASAMDSWRFLNQSNVVS